jgi:hypothetical protein
MVMVDVVRVIVLAAAFVGSACYEPEMRACALSCGANVGCPGDMVCGSVGMCVFDPEDPCDGTSDIPGDAGPQAPDAVVRRPAVLVRAVADRRRREHER